MMKKTRWLLLVIGLLFAMGALAGCRSKKTKKAEEFMTAGMYKQAIVVLEQQINDEPTNAELHFLLGKCKLAVGETEQAEESFARTTQLNPDLGKKIGREVLGLGQVAITDQTTWEKGGALMRLAVGYDPALKGEVARLYLERAKLLIDKDDFLKNLKLAVSYDEETRPAAAQVLLNKGRKYLERKDYQAGNYLLEQAVAYNPGLKGEVSTLYLEHAKLLTDDNLVHDFLKRAVSYNPKNRPTAGRLLLAKGREHFAHRNYRSGRDLIKAAAEYNTALKSEIATLFLEQAKVSTGEDDILENLRLAVFYHEANRPVAAQLLLNRGRKDLESRKYKTGNSLLDQAVAYDPGLKVEVAKLYLDRAQLLTDDSLIQDFLRRAVSYNPNNRQTAAQFLLGKGRERFGKKEYRQGLDLLLRAKTIDTSISEGVGELLFKALEVLGEKTAPNLVDGLVAESLKISPDRTQKSLLVNTEGLIQQGKPSLAIGRLKTLITLGNIRNQEVKSLLLKCTNELIQSDLAGFRQGMELLLKTYPEITKTKELMTRYLYGVYLWNFGPKDTALAALRSVAKEITIPCLDLIFKPIPAKQYPVNVTQSPGGTLELTITSILVSDDQKSMVINITLHNDTKEKQYFIFPRTPPEKKNLLAKIKGKWPKSIIHRYSDTSREEWINGATKGLKINRNFYLVDDVGNTLLPENTGPYFSGAPNSLSNFPLPRSGIGSFKADRFCSNIIALDAGQKITERIKFPMVAGGATSIKFIFPGQQYSDGQKSKGITFESIILRKVKFSTFGLGRRTPAAKQPTPKKVVPKVSTKGAASQLKLAKAYIASGLDKRAKAVIEEIISKYPKSSEASEAKTLLKAID